MLFSSYLFYFIQKMYVLGSGYYGLYLMDEKCSNTKCHWKVKVDYTCNKGPFISWFLFCVFSGGFNHIKFKSLTQIHEPLSRVLLVYIHYIFSINFLYVGGFVSSHSHLCTSLRFSTKGPCPIILTHPWFISLWILVLVVQLRPRYQILVPYVSANFSKGGGVGSE